MTRLGKGGATASGRGQSFGPLLIGQWCIGSGSAGSERLASCGSQQESSSSTSSAPVRGGAQRANQEAGRSTANQEGGHRTNQQTGRTDS